MSLAQPWNTVVALASFTEKVENAEFLHSIKEMCLFEVVFHGMLKEVAPLSAAEQPVVPASEVLPANAHVGELPAVKLATQQTWLVSVRPVSTISWPGGMSIVSPPLILSPTSARTTALADPLGSLLGVH